jgi:hypothetical protein
MNAKEFAAELGRYTFFDERITLGVKGVSGRPGQVRVCIGFAVFKNVSLPIGWTTTSAQVDAMATGTVHICEIFDGPFYQERAQQIVEQLWRQFCAHELQEQIRFDGERVHWPHNE